MVEFSSELSQRQAIYSHVYQSMLDFSRYEETDQVWDQSSAPHLFDGMLRRLGFLFSVYPEYSINRVPNSLLWGNSTYDGTKLTWMLKNDESGSLVSLCLSCTNASTKGADSMSLVFGLAGLIRLSESRRLHTR